jgi:hypothetical protein
MRLGIPPLARPTALAAMSCAGDGFTRTGIVNALIGG